MRGRRQSYTESGHELGRHGFTGERQTAKTFERPEYRFLVVANKFQTGFDQPLLHTMYVDKKLGGVNAVQTLSRLNRTHPGQARAPWPCSTSPTRPRPSRRPSSPTTRPTLLSEKRPTPICSTTSSSACSTSTSYTEAEVRRLRPGLLSMPRTTQDQLYAALDPYVRARCQERLADDEQVDFRGQLTDYVRLYAFLSQVLSFRRRRAREALRLRPLPAAADPGRPAPSCRSRCSRTSTWSPTACRRRASGGIDLERGSRTGLDSPGAKDPRGAAAEDLEPLSVIIAALNERFGLEPRARSTRVTLGPDDGEAWIEDASLDASARANTRDNVRLTFDEKVRGRDPGDRRLQLRSLQADHRRPGLRHGDQNLLFDLYLRNHRQPRSCSPSRSRKTLEFKSTLRWNLREERKDPRS